MQLAQVHWDDQLLHKYNVSGPRYTSYPTALSFQDGYGQQQLATAMAQSPRTGLSLYIHIPFCHQLCYYCGCNKIVTRHQSKADIYLDYLAQEMALQAAHAEKYQVRQLHLGGGTPTFLTAAQMTRLLNLVRQYFNLASDCEMGIEIDPRSIDLDMLPLLKQLGFNRVSFGVQDFNADVQAAVNRSQDSMLLDRLMQQARELGFVSINCDLIYGLPLQTPESFAQTVEHLLRFSPDRVSVFNYAHLPERFAAQRKIKESQMPAAEQKLTMFKNTLAQMQQAGYQFIGMDHFAKPSDGLAQAQQQGVLHRNFQGYTTHGDCDLLGLGVSAISQIGSMILQNQRELKDYYQAVEQGSVVFKGLTLQADDELRAAVIRQLICHFQLDTQQIAEQYAIEFSRYFAQELADLQGFIADGMLEINDQHIVVTGRGRLFIRNICMVFDAYLRREAKLNRFSRVL